MQSTLIQMSFLMAGGIGWRIFRPMGLTAEETRKVLTSVVYYFFLPAMILEVLWTSEIGVHSLQFTVLGIASTLFGMLCIWLLGILLKYEHYRFGAVILAASFPNVTYLGLPVLEQTFGPSARSVVIQLDLFAVSPLLFTVGIVIARYYGRETAPAKQPLWTFINAPPFWAAGLAVLLNKTGITPPHWLLATLKLLSVAVVPLMLFSIGLALSWKSIHLRNVPYVIPVILIKLLLIPLFAIFLVGHLTLAHDDKAPAALDMAMPSMVLGIVLCDRYQLDGGLYAMAVTVTTALSLFTLPFWHQLLLTL